MKDRRGAGFPFSIGCMSQSAVAVADPLDKKQQQPPPQAAEAPSSSPTTAAAQDKGRRSVSRRSVSEKGAGGDQEAAGGGGVSEEEKARAAAVAAAASSGIVAAGVHRLIKGIKSLSQVFALYDNGEDDEEEEEREIVIGYPTDVQHIGHIGWNGVNKVGGMDMGMVSAFSLPSSLSLHHLEVAMDAGAGATATCTN